MKSPNRDSWLVRATVIGVLYCIIGFVFALPSHQVRMWRLAAWVASAVLYAAHIAYEHLRLRNSARSIALHVAAAVAIGAFGLAVVAFIHSLFVPPNYTRWRFGVALIAWPLITALPAFVVALTVAWLLIRFFTVRSGQFRH
ncbi:MAG TPA: hypothetical protein VHR36_14665 [Pyrinomonadaceae bacterium]|nr:hypothetical protein [Pyrinomonadaceae bacterium]